MLRLSHREPDSAYDLLTNLAALGINFLAVLAQGDDDAEKAARSLSA